MRVISLRYISRNPPMFLETVRTCSFVRSVAHFICVLSPNFSYFLTERTNI
jgi:hypothetical protein